MSILQQKAHVSLDLFCLVVTTCRARLSLNLSIASHLLGICDYFGGFKQHAECQLQPFASRQHKAQWVKLALSATVVPPEIQHRMSQVARQQVE